MAASKEDVELSLQEKNNDEHGESTEENLVTPSEKPPNNISEQPESSPVSSGKDTTENKTGEFKIPAFPSFRMPLPKNFKKESKQDEVLESLPKASDKSGASKRDKDCVVESKNLSRQAEGSKPKTSSETLSKHSAKSPAEKLAAPPPVPYKEPQWSGLPDVNYTLDVLKNGCIVSKVALNNKPYHLFGRLDVCDVPLNHPSLSRYHAVLQYRAFDDDNQPKGFYLYDLNSTHGTFMNKSQLTPKTYYRMRVGYMFKLAGSSRLFILQGPDEDQEAESNLTVTELKEIRQKQMEKIEALEKDGTEQEEEEEEEQKSKKGDDSTGIDWGMGEDAVEDDTHENPFATLESKEPLDLKDPKKTLRGYFEREGEELEYETDEKGYGHNRQFVCRVRLPIDDANGQPIYAEAGVSGKKKEAVLACAAEACRILDNHGVLRQATHESKKRKAKDWAEDDYYDSDDDTFLDRTGIIEKKRLLRMKKAGKEKTVVDTYASLIVKLTAVDKEVDDIEKQLVEKQALLEAETASSEDALDAFMKSIKSGSGTDKVSRSKMKIKLFDLRKEQARLQRLIKLAMPTAMPELKQPEVLSKKKETSKTVLVGRMPMVGAMKKGTISFKKFKTGVVTSVKSSRIPDVEEEEEEIEDKETSDHSVPMETSKQFQKDNIAPQDPTVVPDSTSMFEESSDTVEKQSPQTLQGVSEKSDICEIEHGNGDDRGNSEELNIDKAVSNNTQIEPVSDTGVKYRSQDGETMEKPWQQVTDKTKGKQKDKIPAKKKVVEQYDEDDTYSAWMPPEGQTGDGKTHLNEKYGY
ncbi:kanadaptin-like [Glandiceps talaboti]